MMTIPFRPAPPPPNNSSLSSNSESRQSTSHRNEYQLPVNSNETNKQKRLPPPRPPPPKHLNNGYKTFELKKPEHQSINILSNFFGNSQSSNRLKTSANKQTLSSRKTESPSPPSLKLDSLSSSIELISFDSPEESPQFSVKFNDGQRTSSQNSFETNSMQSNSSGFSSGAISTLTNNSSSGFEDDYFSSGTGSSCSNMMTYQNIDPFSSPPILDSNNQSFFNTAKQMQSNSYGDSTFYASTNEIKTTKKIFPVEFDDSLSNGKSLLKPEPALAMPTIIRPIVKPAAAAAATAANKQSKPIQSNYEPLKSISLIQSQPEIIIKTQPKNSSNIPAIANSDEQSYGIALYDFDAVHAGDLSLKVNDKIYLIRQVDNEWYYGKNKRGCEGIFPFNYINIVIPLKQDTSIANNLKNEDNSYSAHATTSTLSNQSYSAKTMYDFISEVDGDLTIRVCCVIYIFRVCVSILIVFFFLLL